MKIKNRLLLLLLPTLVVLLGVPAVYSYISANSQAGKLAYAEAQVIALERSDRIFSKFLQAEAAASSLAAGLMEMRNAGGSRETMSLAVKGVASSSKDYFGVWALWDANSFDGKDAEYMRKAGYGNEEGRASAYWVRENDVLAFGPSENYDAEEYYTLPKAAGRLRIIPPYRDMETPGHVLMTTVTMPLMENGTALGAVGIDIEMEFVRELLKDIKPYETGYAMLFSDAGTILAGPRAAGTEDADLPTASDELRDRIRGGERFSTIEKSLSDGAPVRCFYIPVKLESFAAPWFFMVALPEDKVMAGSNRDLLVQICLGFVSLALLVGLVFYTAAGVSDTLRRIAAYAQDVANGNHNAAVDSRGFTLELLDLQYSLQSMLSSLLTGMRQIEERGELARQEAKRALAATDEAEKAREISEKNHQAIQEVAGRVDAVARKLRDTTSRLNEKIAAVGSEIQEQNNLMGETVVAISGMAESVSSVSQNAGEAAEAAERARERAQQGADVVDRTITAFAELQREAGELNGRMVELNDRTEGIGGILVVINDIAEQTNLLALNAAIEAARAGEAGRGFAVVAAEVRKLAEKTVLATRQVEESIHGIRASMRVSAEGIARTVKTVQDTAELGHSAQSSLGDIVDLVRSMSGQIRDIANLCRNQATTSDHTADIVDRLRQISLIVSEAMEEAGFITRNLDPEAKELALLVERLSSK